MKRGRFVRWCAAVVRAALVASATAVTTTSASSVPPDESARGKEWVATGSAYGASAVEREGVTVFWSGKIYAGFLFTVDESGVADGRWNMGGFGTQDVGISDFLASAELDYSGGGTVGGNDTALVARGNATTTAVIQPIGQSINTTAPIPALSIDVEVFCNEMWGDWALTVEQAFEDGGFSGADAATRFDGVMIGHVRYEGFSDEAIAALTENGFTLDMVNSWAGDYSLADRVEFELVTVDAHFTAVAAAAQRLEDEYPNWSGPDGYAVVEQIHTLLNVLGNLSGCTQRVIGEDQIERWTDSLHRLLRRLIGKLVGPRAVSGSAAAGPGLRRSECGARARGRRGAGHVGVRPARRLRDSLGGDRRRRARPGRRRNRGAGADRRRVAAARRAR